MDAYNRELIVITEAGKEYRIEPATVPGSIAIGDIIRLPARGRATARMIVHEFEVFKGRRKVHRTTVYT